MSGQDNEQLTLFREDFPASLFPWLESKKGKTTTGICGRKCSELSESLRRVGSSVRMYLESCDLPLPTLYRTWSVKAITSSCLILKLRLSERRTEENGSHLWPTPCAMDHATERMKSSQQKPGSMHSVTLPDAVRMIPTPAARDYKGSNSMEHLMRENDAGRVMRNHMGQLANYVKLYPTATTGAGLCGGTGNFQQLKALAESGQITEEERRQMSQGNGGQLNPTWVEWLMGYPIGWTDLNA